MRAVIPSNIGDLTGDLCQGRHHNCKAVSDSFAIRRVSNAIAFIRTTKEEGARYGREDAGRA